MLDINPAHTVIGPKINRVRKRRTDGGKRENEREERGRDVTERHGNQTQSFSSA